MRPITATLIAALAWSVGLNAASAASPAAATMTCEIKSVEFHGWKAEQIANRWVTLTIVPQLGGRLMQVRFGDHDYLFVNEQLKGQVFSPEVSAAQRTWFNYGGDKIWPMPEGEDDEQHWAGATGSVLDAAPFRFEVVSNGDRGERGERGGRCAVRLTGPPDPQVGLQYIRDISIGADSPEIRFHATMKNVTGYPLRWSEQSVTQYTAADPKNPADYNHDFWGLTPANPRSEYLNGYHVRTGPGANPSYAVRDGLFTVHWSNIGGEVWIDSPGPWVAVVDGMTNYAMVERFHYERTAEYPDKATVIFYTTGPARRSEAAPAAAPAPPPIYYMEAEINSPMIDLAPGESYSMDTEWFPTRMGRDFKSATYAGVIGTPLTATMSPQGLTLAGAFGVFFEGKLTARFYDRGGMALGSATLPAVTPLEMVTLQTTVSAPADTARVSLHLIDTNGVDRGPLGEVKLSEMKPAH